MGLGTRKWATHLENVVFQAYFGVSTGYKSPRQPDPAICYCTTLCRQLTSLTNPLRQGPGRESPYAAAMRAARAYAKGDYRPRQLPSPAISPWATLFCSLGARCGP